MAVIPLRASRAGHTRAGHTLVELTVALFLAGFVAALVASLVAGSTRALADLLGRSEAAETRRTVAALLHEELSIGVEGRDWRLEGERAVVLRAFRGWARVCGRGAEEGSLRVAWRGDRLPDPARDSLLVLGAGGDWTPAALAHVGGAPASAFAAPCAAGPGERVADWRVSGGPEAPLPETPLLARYFETGRYSLEDGAFRYRRGTAGRQPLTPEVVAPASRFHPVPGGGIEVELHLRLGPRPAAPATPSVGAPDRWVVRGDPAHTPGAPAPPGAP